MSDKICLDGYGASGDTCMMIMDDKECLCAVIEERDALKGQIEAYKKDVFRDLGRDEETGLILFRTWKDQAHIYKEQRDDLAAALRYYANDHKNPDDGPWGINSYDFGKVASEALAKLDGEK